MTSATSNPCVKAATQRKESERFDTYHVEKPTLPKEKKTGGTR